MCIPSCCKPASLRDRLRSSIGSSTKDSATVSLPFYLRADNLPAKLPSISEIHEADEVFVEQTGRKVIGFGSHFIVKFGLQVDLEEGQTMIYIKQHSTVPVPIVYALFSDDLTGQNYIIMERIQGTTLQDEWTRLSQQEKTIVVRNIRTCLKELRTIPSPRVYCSVGNKPLRHELFWTAPGEPANNGPFKTESDFNNALLRTCEASPVLVGKATYYRRLFPSLLRGHRARLTHGDLQRKNILVQKPGLDVVIVDWEVAGWYPEYWEYVQAVLACVLFQDDWSTHIHGFLNPFYPEFSLFNGLMYELR